MNLFKSKLPKPNDLVKQTKDSLSTLAKSDGKSLEKVRRICNKGNLVYFRKIKEESKLHLTDVFILNFAGDRRGVEKCCWNQNDSFRGCRT